LVPAGKAELTFAPLSWAGAGEVDAGTLHIVKDAFQIIFDKDGILTKLVAAVISDLRIGQAALMNAAAN
jgi:hypothetical protein